MEKEKTISEHIKDLKKGTLWIGGTGLVLFIILFSFAPTMINFLTNYYGIAPSNLASLSPFENLNSRINFTGGLTLAFMFPLILFGLYNFSKETLPKKVKKNAGIIMTSSFFLALIGVLFGVFVFSKMVLGTLMTSHLLANPVWSIQSVIGFVSLSSLALAVMMQTTIIIPSLNSIGLLNMDKMKKYRLVILLGVLIVSALITPPDMISQVMMTIPIYMSFETGMFLTKFNLNDKEVKQ